MNMCLRRVSAGVCLLVSGCAHYQQALSEYRKAEPTPFYQKTLEWVTAEPGQMQTGSVTPSAGEILAIPQDLRQQDPAARVLASVLDRDPEWVRDRLAGLADEARLSQSLAGSLAWSTLVVAVAKFNPAVRAAHQEWLATLHQYSQAEFLEGLVREYRTFARYLDVTVGQSLNTEMNQAFFPYPSSIALKGEMIREQVRLAEVGWEMKLRGMLVALGEAYFDYQFQQRGSATVGANIELLENLLRVVQQRVGAGMGSQADLLKLQNDLERQRNLLGDFQSRLRADAAAINALLGRAADVPLGLPNGGDLGYESPDVDTLTATALEHLQEVRAQQARIARTEIALRMGEVMNRPLASQGYSTLDRGMMPEASEGAPRMAYGAEADPSELRPSYAQAEAFLAEMRQRLQAEKAMLDQIEAQTRALARTAIEDLDIAHREHLLLGDIVLPQNSSAYEIAQSGYAAGTLTFLDLLDAERMLIDSRLEFEQSRRDLNLALIRLANVRGKVPL